MCVDYKIPHEIYIFFFETEDTAQLVKTNIHAPPSETRSSTRNCPTDTNSMRTTRTKRIPTNRRFPFVRLITCDVSPLQHAMLARLLGKPVLDFVDSVPVFRIESDFVLLQTVLGPVGPKDVAIQAVLRGVLVVGADGKGEVTVVVGCQFHSNVHDGACFVFAHDHSLAVRSAVFV